MFSKVEHEFMVAGSGPLTITYRSRHTGQLEPDRHPKCADDPPPLQDGDPVGQGAHMARVVADEQHPQAQAQEDALELQQDTHGRQVVQGGKRFVEHQEFRLRDQGARQRHPLQFTARQFVGQPPQDLAGQLQQVQDFSDLSRGGLLAGDHVGAWREAASGRGGTVFMTRSGSAMIWRTEKTGFTAR